jgi:hypothetical protein
MSTPDDYLTEREVEEQYGTEGLRVVKTRDGFLMRGSIFRWVLRPHHPVPVIKRSELEAAIVADAEQRLQESDDIYRRVGVIEHMFLGDRRR